MKDYQVVIKNNPAIEFVKTKWTELASQLNTDNVFLDWFWIGAWLRQANVFKPVLLEFQYKQVTVGLGLFCAYTKRVCGINIRQHYLHRCGRTEYDQPWIEFNGFLTLPQHQPQCVQAFMQWIVHQNIDEWVISLTETAALWTENSDVNVDVEVDSTPAYSVSLHEDIATLDNYIATLSANSRSTIRRAIKYIENTYGAIKFDVVPNQLDTSNLQHLTKLHKQRWHQGEQKSGFYNPLFSEFHQYVQAHPSAKHRVETFIFNAGEVKLGYLYNLVGPQQVKFYLSAINYCDETNRFQPGLVMHAFAIVYYAQHGLETYDFMGGENRYKRSLSNNQYLLHAITLRPKTSKNTCLQLLRKIKKISNTPVIGRS